MGSLNMLGTISPNPAFTQTITTFGLSGIVGEASLLIVEDLSPYILTPPLYRILYGLGRDAEPTLAVDERYECRLRDNCRRCIG